MKPNTIIHMLPVPEFLIELFNIPSTIIDLIEFFRMSPMVETEASCPCPRTKTANLSFPHREYCSLNALTPCTSSWDHRGFLTLRGRLDSSLNDVRSFGSNRLKHRHSVARPIPKVSQNSRAPRISANRVNARSLSSCFGPISYELLFQTRPNPLSIPNILIRGSLLL